MKGKQIGLNVRATRVGLGLSQGALAELVGLSQPRIACIESGRYCPTVSTLLSLASVLNCDINILLKDA